MKNEGTAGRAYRIGEVKYSFRMNVDGDRPISFTTWHFNDIECVLRKVDNNNVYDPNWHLIIIFNQAESIDKIVEAANIIQDDIFNWLSFVINIRIDQIRMTYPSLSPLPGEGGIAYIIAPMANVIASGRGGNRPLNSIDVKNIETILAQPQPQKTKLIGLYRSALNTDDPIVKFLILYLIIYEIAGNKKQAAVDNEIKKYEPSIKTTSWSWKNKRGEIKNSDETTYTRLRNEITHRVNVTPEENRREILSNLDNFQIVVHQALVAHNQNLKYED